MITWIKPNGNEVTTNEFPGSIEAAKAAGWKQKKAAPDGPTKYADMGAPELKELISKLDGSDGTDNEQKISSQYTNKPAAVAYLEANFPQE